MESPHRCHTRTAIPHCVRRVDGRHYSRAGTIQARLGSSEIWQFTNPSNRVHPMHLHGMLFRIRERSTGVVHKADRSLDEFGGEGFPGS